MSQSAKWGIGLVAAAAAAGIGWWLISPLFIDVEVDESVPEEVEAAIERLSAEVESSERSAFVEEMEKTAMENNEMAEDMPLVKEPRLLAVGAFADVAHEGSGDVKVFEIPGGDIYVRFENFSVLNGPDLRVVLSKSTSVSSASDLGAGMLELGKLKGNKGSQNYVIAADQLIDITEYKSVVIYCKPFKVVFNAAFLDFEADALTVQEVPAAAESAAPVQTVEELAAELVGAWKPVPPSAFGWADIVFDAGGEYFTHLGDKPFDSGTWSLNGNTLTLTSWSPDMSMILTGLRVEGNVLYVQYNGTATMWGKVEE